jgi:hypothetical protein
MLNSKFKNTLENYGPLRFSFDYVNTKWTINITFKDPDLINPVWEGFYETEKINDILIDLMPGILLFEEDSAATLENGNSVYSFEKTSSQSTIVLYEGEIFEDCLQIQETSFENELDFYIYVFQKFNHLQFGLLNLKKNGLATPLEIFVNALEKINCAVSSVNSIIGSDDDYKYFSFEIEKTGGSINLITYPQPDPIIGYVKDSMSIQEFIEHSDSFGPKLNGILKAISKNTLEQHLKSLSYEI